MPQMMTTRPEWYSRINRRPPRNQKERMRVMLPYGLWTCADGRQVLFNRNYDPIWWRYPGQPATAADLNDWVKWEQQEWFFCDADAPWDGWNGREHAKTRRRCGDILKSWGLDPEPWRSRRITAR
jgi:hypothetical protein